MPMSGRVRSFTLTMSGVAQPLSDGLPITTVGGADDVSCQEIHLFNPTSNAAVKVGGATLTTADFGHTVLADAHKVYACGDSRLKPSDFYVLGTASQKLHVLLLTY
jgi:hypothetical protein